MEVNTETPLDYTTVYMQSNLLGLIEKQKKCSKYMENKIF